MIRKGILHCHTYASLRDSAMSPSKLLATAKALGATAIALTDHGTLTGIENEWRALATNNADINLIAGVEAYIEDGNHRSHLILMAKDYAGYRAIADAVTDSYSNMHDGFPCLTKTMLKKHFGFGSKGHDHVVATTACAGGVIARILLSNDTAEHEIAKLQERQKRYRNPSSPQYQALCERQKAAIALESSTNEALKSAKALAKKPYAARKKSVERQKGNPDYAKLRAELDADINASADAANAISHLVEQHKAAKTSLQQINAIIKEEMADHERWNNIQTRIDEIKSGMKSPDELIEQATIEMRWYKSLFGNTNFFAEVQYHGLEMEKQAMPVIATIAANTHTPLVAANDAHMATNSADDIRARQIVRSLRFDKFNDIDVADREVYLKTDEELFEALSQILPVEQVKEAMCNIGTVCDMCHVVWPTGEEHYPKFDKTINSDELLRTRCYENITWRFPNKRGWTKEYADRLESELGIITKMGFADYHLIVADFLRYGRALGKIDFDNPPQAYIDNPYDLEGIAKAVQNKIGIGIGPGRGSAVGSLVCYLLGITALDPIKNALIFERFLNPERVTMPDIDSDFRPDIRNKVLDYCKHKYGEKAVCCIMTNGTMQARAAIRNAARVYALEFIPDADKWSALGDTIARAVPDELNIKLANCGLEEKFSDNADAMKIIHDAYLIEGCMSSIGMHAAGVIIADNGNVSDYVPLMYIPGKGEFASQADKDHVESLGLLKMDFLGLTNLSIINDTIKLVHQRHGFILDPEKFMQEPTVFQNIFSTGNTNTVFQFESSGMKEMLRRFKPSNIDDVILLVAAYRPGPMQYLDKIIKTKHGELQPDYVIPDMAKVLRSTYGCVVYQEQVMQIFSQFAGFSLGEADIIRRYMSKKKTEKFMAYKDKFINGLCDHGAARDKAETFWDELVEFSRYAFNRSHAAAYAYVAYYTAWLKWHYPVEYHCAALNNIPSERYSKMIADCKSLHIEVTPPDINRAQLGFALDKNSIVVGLGNIKGVVSSALPIIEERNANGPFTSLQEFITRCNPDKTTVENFIKAGAFDCIHKNRKALLYAATEYLNINKLLKKKLADLQTLEAENPANEKKIANCKERISTLQTAMNEVIIDDTHEDILERLLAEQEMTGAFISAHPVDSYGAATQYGCTTIAEAETNEIQSILGLITNLRVVMRKSDHKEMCFFTLEDPTGSIEVCVYTDAYSKNINAINESTVVKVQGKVIEEEDSVKLVARTITVTPKPKQPIVLFAPSWDAWKNTMESQVKRYLVSDGHRLKVFVNGRFTDTKYTVSPEIRKDPMFNKH